MKKIIITLLSLVMVLTFTACGANANGGVEKYGDYTREDLQSEAQTLAMSVLQVDGDEAAGLSENYKKQADRSSGKEAEQYKIFGTLIGDWGKAAPEVGEFIEFTDFSVDKTGKSLTTTLLMHFDKRDAKLLTTYQTFNMQISSININPVYTLGETMSKAALNTVIGLCIVFTVLVLISLLISCFKLINIAQKKKEEKEKAAKKEKEAETPAISTAPAKASGGNEEEIAAAIAAAIAYSQESGIPTDSLVVRSVVRRY